MAITVQLNTHQITTIRNVSVKRGLNNMILPTEITLKEQGFKQAHNDHVRHISVYFSHGMFFDFDWSTGELSYEGYKDTDKLILREEHLAMFDRKSMRGFNYLRFGINRDTHDLTLRIV